MITFLIALIVAIIFVIIVMPPFIKRMHNQGFLGKDMNKYKKPLIAELGGVIVFLGFSFGVFCSIFISTYLKAFSLDLRFYLGFSTIAMIAFVGFIDDIGWKRN